MAGQDERLKQKAHRSMPERDSASSFSLMAHPQPLLYVRAATALAKGMVGLSLYESAPGLCSQLQLPPIFSRLNPRLCLAHNRCYGERLLEDSHLGLMTEEAKEQALRLCDPKNSSPWIQCERSCDRFKEFCGWCAIDNGCAGGHVTLPKLWPCSVQDRGTPSS